MYSRLRFSMSAKIMKNFVWPDARESYECFTTDRRTFRKEKERGNERETNVLLKHW